MQRGRQMPEKAKGCNLRNEVVKRSRAENQQKSECTELMTTTATPV